MIKQKKILIILAGTLFLGMSLWTASVLADGTDPCGPGSILIRWDSQAAWGTYLWQPICTPLNPDDPCPGKESPMDLTGSPTDTGSQTASIISKFKNIFSWFTDSIGGQLASAYSAISSGRKGDARKTSITNKIKNVTNVQKYSKTKGGPTAITLGTPYDKLVRSTDYGYKGDKTGGGSKGCFNDLLLTQMGPKKIGSCAAAIFPYGSIVKLSTPRGTRYCLNMDTGPHVIANIASGGYPPVVDFYQLMGATTAGDYGDTTITIYPYNGNIPFQNLDKSTEAQYRNYDQVMAAIGN